MKRHSGPDGPGFWQLDGSLFKRFGIGGIALRRVPRRRLQRDELGALGEPEHRLQHRDRQHVRPDHRHERQPAQDPLRRSVCVLNADNVQLPIPNSQFPRCAPWELGVGSWRNVTTPASPSRRQFFPRTSCARPRATLVGQLAAFRSARSARAPACPRRRARRCGRRLPPTCGSA